MNNLSDSATKKRDLLSKTSDDASEFKWGFDAGYEVGREERGYDLSCVLYAATNGKWSKPSDKDSMLSVIHEEQENLQSQVQLLEDALKIISKVRNTDSKNGPWTIAKQALESLDNMRGEK